MSNGTGATGNSLWSRTWFKWLVALVIIVIVAVIAVVIWDKPLANARARKKAQELYDKAKARGFELPPEKDAVDGFVDLYGTDGGATADTAGSDISRALLALNVNRSGEVNQRPGGIDRDLLEFEWLVLQVYRPKEAAKYGDFIRSLKDQNTIN